LFRAAESAHENRSRCWAEQNAPAINNARSYWQGNEVVARGPEQILPHEDQL